MNGLFHKILSIGCYPLHRINVILEKGEVEYYRRTYSSSNKYVIGKNVRFYKTTSLTSSNVGSIVIGDETCIRGRIVTFPSGGKVLVGKYCYIGEGTQIWSEEEIEIGNRVLIAHNVNIFDSSTHPINKAERHDQFKKIVKRGFPVKQYDSLKKSKIVIKDDAWIATGVTIMKGVTIGCGAIVSAGSVVIDDVPSNSIVAGNPAKVIKILE